MLLSFPEFVAKRFVIQVKIINNAFYKNQKIKQSDMFYNNNNEKKKKQ